MYMYVTLNRTFLNCSLSKSTIISNDFSNPLNSDKRAAQKSRRSTDRKTSREFYESTSLVSDRFARSIEPTRINSRLMIVRNRRRTQCTRSCQT